MHSVQRDSPTLKLVSALPTVAGAITVIPTFAINTSVPRLLPSSMLMTPQIYALNNAPSATLESLSLVNAFASVLLNTHNLQTQPTGFAGPPASLILMLTRPSEPAFRLVPRFLRYTNLATSASHNAQTVSSPIIQLVPARLIAPTAPTLTTPPIDACGPVPLSP